MPHFSVSFDLFFKLSFTLFVQKFMMKLILFIYRNNTGNASPNESNDADRKRSRRPNRSKKFMVEISYAARIPMQAIASALQGKETDYLQDAIRVLDVILRQSAARQGCLLVRQSFFHNDVQNFVHIGGGVTGVRGFHSSFRTTQGGLSLNIGKFSFSENLMCIIRLFFVTFWLLTLDFLFGFDFSFRHFNYDGSTTRPCR